MKFGFLLPTCMAGINHPIPFVKAKDLIELAQMAERLGFYSLWGNDHITPWWKPQGQLPNWYEILISMACCATSTNSIKLGLGVMVMPYRDPIILAKQVATLDVFSEGRVLFGLGIGSVRSEFELLKPSQAKANRGAMLDESLEAFRLLFTGSEVSFSGRYYSFQGVALNPKPLQEPIPLYISGSTPATIERVAKFGTGLMIMGAPLEALRAKTDELRAASEKAGRDASEIDVAVSTAISLDSTHERAVERFLTSVVGRRFIGRHGGVERVMMGNLIGTPSEVAEKLGQMEEAGISHNAPQHIAANTFEELKEQMQIFGEEVIPLCR